MTTFRVVYPCGHEDLIENAPFIKGRKHDGNRPSELHITGDFLEKYYEWQSHIVHPCKSTMTHNGQVIYLNGERLGEE